MPQARAVDVSSEGREAPLPLPVRAYLADLDQLIAQHDVVRQDRVLAAIAAGTAARPVVQRVALEAYWLGRWTTPELALLIANAPDAHALTMEHSAHYQHWTRSFAGESGYLGAPHHALGRLEVCRQLGLDDEAVRGYVPLAETIAMAGTMLYSVRRSYAEGLAVIGYAGERLGIAEAYGARLSAALARHYGTEPQAARAFGCGVVADLFDAVALTRGVQDRCREAIRNYLLVAAARVQTMNRWLS
jgi:hypothetical protein